MNETVLQQHVGVIIQYMPPIVFVVGEFIRFFYGSTSQWS